MGETYGSDWLNTRRIIHRLALEWIRSELPGDELTFVDCLDCLGRLQQATQRIPRTEAIFERVFQQAQQLGQSAEWVAVELRFETLAQAVSCRRELALRHLKDGGSVNDTTLDCYNQRLTRFINA